MIALPSFVVVTLFPTVRSGTELANLSLLFGCFLPT